MNKTTENSQDEQEQLIEVGMVVEATEGDLGEEDLTKPKVSKIIQDEQGNLEKVVVTKGVIFQKQIEIPAERIQSIDPELNDPDSAGKIVVKAEEAETEALGAIGLEALGEVDTSGPIEQMQEAMPTAEGMRRREEANQLSKDNPNLTPTKGKRSFLGQLGPGFLAGMAGNDSSAVTTYSVDGAKNGYGHLWLLLLATPLLQSVQYACAKIGRISQNGLAEILREHYGYWVALLASLVLIAANVAMIAADLVAVGSGLELITGLNWVWFVIPVALLLWYITVYQNFESIKKIFLIMSLAFITYLITGVLSGADWGQAITNTFIPHLDFGFASISSAVALLGATISPYTMFWQVQGEKEEQRDGSTKQQVKMAAIDIATGVGSGNLIAYFIIICTSATIFTHHQDIQTASDAARALEPLLGSFAKYLFAIGLIGAGLIAIPVLLASTSYAVSGTFGWPSSLSKKPWQNEGFYLILTIALIASIGLALAGIEPIQLMFWANVLAGILAPILVVIIFFVGTNRKIMGKHGLGWITKTGLIITALLMFTATGLLFYGLLTGQGG